MGKPTAPMAVVSDELDWKHLALTLAWSMALKAPRNTRPQRTTTQT